MSVGMTPTTPEQALGTFLVFVPWDVMREEVEATLSDITEAVPKPIQLKDSQSWYRERYGVCGNWASWAVEAMSGRCAWERKPYFNGLVVLDGPLPDGAAQMVGAAMRHGKPIYAWVEHHLKPVHGLVPDGEGWALDFNGVNDAE